MPTVTKQQRQELWDLSEELCGGCAYGLKVFKDGDAPYCQHWHKTHGLSSQGCGADQIWRIFGIDPDKKGRKP